MPDPDDPKFASDPIAPTQGAAPAADAGAISGNIGNGSAPPDPTPPAPKTDGDTPPKAPDPSDAYWSNLAGATKARDQLQASLTAAAKGSPDAAAKAQQMSRQTGVPADVAARNPQAVDGVAKAQQSDSLLKDHPELAKWLSFGPNAAVAHDDTPALTTISHTIQSIIAQREGREPLGILAPGYVFDRGGNVVQVIPQGEHGSNSVIIGSLEDYAREQRRLGNYAAADAANLAQEQARFAEQFGGAGGGWNPLVHIAAGGAPIVSGVHFLTGQGAANDTGDQDVARLGQASQTLAPGLYGDAARFLGTFLATGGPLGGGLAPVGKAALQVSGIARLTSAVAGERAAGWLTTLAERGAQAAPMTLPAAANTAREKGSLAGIADFLAQSGIMALGGGPAAGRIQGAMERAAVARGWGEAVKNLLKGSTSMGAQNAALVAEQHVLGHLTGGGPIDGDRLLTEMGKAFLTGNVLGAIFEAGPAIAAKKHADATAALGSMEMGDKLHLAIQSLQASKLQARSPEAMRSLLDAHLGEGAGDRNVYFQSKDWQDHWNAQGVDPVAQAKKAGALQSFVEAQATGGHMSMPLSAYLQTMAESKDPRAMVGLTKASPGAPNPIEAAEFNRQTPEQAAQYAQQAAAMARQAGDEGMAHPAYQQIHDEAAADIQALRPGWSAAKVDALAHLHARMIAGLARMGSTEGAPVDPLALHQKISYASELPESLRGKGYDALNSMMERIQRGEGAGANEQEMADLAAHAEAVGGALDQHALAGVADLMKGEAEKTLGQSVLHAPGESLAFHDLKRQWAKAHGDREPMRGSHEWDQLVQEARRVDRANGKTYEQAPAGWTEIDDTGPGPGGPLSDLERASLFPVPVGDRRAVIARRAAAIHRDLAPPAEGYTRLWRGNRPGETGINPSFTNSLEGIALPFQAGYGGALTFVDVPSADLARYEVRSGAAPGAEFTLPADLAAKAKIVMAPRYEQQARGGYTPEPGGKARITLGPSADASTVGHELAHYALDTLADFAGKEGASPQLKKDMQVLLEHIGVKDLDAWKAMDFEARRAHHERFAESFESYMFQGKLPTPELRSIFRTIRNMVVAAYRAIRGALKLSPEVRNVFDRLLAADDEIARAREEMGAKPAFSSAEQAGMKPEEFAAYLRDFTAEQETDRARLQDKTMEDVERRLTDNWAAEEASVHDGMAAIVDARPEFKAMDALHKGEWPEGAKPEGETGPLKLDRADLVAKYGEDALRQLPGRTGFSESPNRGAPLYAHEGGIPLDSAAAVLGFRSGDELWKALTEATNRNMAIDKMTAAEMRRRHPDADLEAAAQDVLHGAASGKRILRELDSLGKAVGEAPPPVEVLREGAQRAIAALDVRSINPEVHRRAEAKAAREVLENVASGDKRGAYEAAVRRVLNSELFKAAKSAKDAIEEAVDYARKFSRGNVRDAIGKAGGWEWTVSDASGKVLATFKTSDEAKAFSERNGNAPYVQTSSYLGQIDALRERFGFVKNGPPGPRESLTAWIGEQIAKVRIKEGEVDRADAVDAGVVIPDWIAESTDKQLWKDLSFERFSEVVGAIKNIEHMARDVNKLSELISKQQKAALLADMQAVSDANRQPVRKRSMTPGLVDGVYDRLCAADAALRHLGSILNVMDGGKEGGLFWDTIVRPLQECANDDARRQAADAEEIHAAAKAAGYLDGTGAFYRREHIIERDANGKVTFDDYLSHETRLILALNWGREEGRERILTKHMNADQMQRLVLDKLTAKDRDFMHTVWRMFDRKFPELRALEQKLTGVTVDKSNRAPFTNKDGVQFEGGYIPIVYDPRANPDAAKLIEAANAMEAKRGAYGVAKTRDSMTKKVQETTGMSLRLDMGVIHNGLRDTNHRLSHQEVLTGLSKIIADKRFQDMVVKNHGIDAYNVIKSTVTDVAVRPTEELGAFGPFLRHLRTGVPSAAFAWNAFRGIKDVAGSLLQAMTRVSPIYMAKAAGRMFGSIARMESFAKSINAKSSVMADRTRARLRSSEDAFKAARFLGGIGEVMEHLGKAVMHKCHLFTDNLVWQAAYEEQVAKGVEEMKARQIADTIVQATQSSGRTMDLSKFQRGGELNKWLSVAYGFFSSGYNARGRAWDLYRSKGGMLRLFSTYVATIAAPVAIEMMMNSVMRGTQDEKEKTPGELATRFGWESLAFTMAGVPGLRELSGAFNSNFGYSGPAGARGLNALYTMFQDAHHAINDWESGRVKAQKSTSGLTHTEHDIGQAIGIVFHAPVPQLMRTWDGITWAMEHNKNPILPAITGKPAKE